MKVGYFPGCSLSGSSREYSESITAIAPLLGIELVEIPDWNCCGATAAHTMNHELSLSLPARIFALAEKAGMKDILVPCSACYSRLIQTQHELLKDKELKKRICEIIEMDASFSPKILNIVEVLTKIFEEDPDMKFKLPYNKKVACYYGCYLTRPPKIVKSERYEDPLEMESIMTKIGAEPIEWPFKTECCGAGLSVSGTDLVAKLSEKIVSAAVKRGAEAIIVACPMCHTNFDLRRDYIEGLAGKKMDIPVLYISEAIGLAMGIDSKTLGLHRHNVTVN